MKKNISQFNFDIVIVGVGGQGLLTLLQILNEAALKEGYEVKSAEVHGLSQRGGSVEVYCRFGKEIFSPLVKKGGADLIISLEAQEALRGIHFASKETTFLINNFFIPIPGQNTPKIEEISKILKKISPKQSLWDATGQAKKIILVSASDICKKEFGTDVVAGIFLLGRAISKKLIPLKENSITFAIKKVIPEKYLDLNIKTFKLAKTI